jgi:hypothetical protein
VATEDGSHLLGVLGEVLFLNHLQCSNGHLASQRVAPEGGACADQCSNPPQVKWSAIAGNRYSRTAQHLHSGTRAARKHQRCTSWTNGLRPNDVAILGTTC